MHQQHQQQQWEPHSRLASTTQNGLNYIHISEERKGNVQLQINGRYIHTLNCDVDNDGDCRDEDGVESFTQFISSQCDLLTPSPPSLNRNDGKNLFLYLSYRSVSLIRLSTPPGRLFSGRNSQAARWVGSHLCVSNQKTTTDEEVCQCLTTNRPTRRNLT